MLPKLREAKKELRSLFYCNNCKDKMTKEEALAMSSLLSHFLAIRSMSEKHEEKDCPQNKQE